MITTPFSRTASPHSPVSLTLYTIGLLTIEQFIMADADHAIIVSVSAFSSNVAKYDNVESVTAHKYVVSCCLYSSSGLSADSLMISSARNNFGFIA